MKTYLVVPYIDSKQRLDLAKLVPGDLRTVRRRAEAILNHNPDYDSVVIRNYERIERVDPPFKL